MTSAHLIVNPVSGQGAGRRLGPRIRRYLGAALRCRASFSRCNGDMSDQVARVALEGCDPIIVAGGDGSVHEAVNGLMRAGVQATLGIVPIGTGNDFVKVAGIPRRWQAACDLIIGGAPHLVDIGLCNDRYFANSVGVGFDAQVALAARNIPLLRGIWVYGAALARTWTRGVPTPRVTVTDDAGSVTQCITLVAVSNGRYYGGGFHITPGARIDDGLFDVVIADAVGRLGVLRFAPRVIAGTHLGLPIVNHHHATRVVIESDEGLPVQADGELIYRDATRLDIRIIPGRLRLLCEPAFAVPDQRRDPR